jgi:transposase
MNTKNALEVQKEKPASMKKNSNSKQQRNNAGPSEFGERTLFAWGAKARQNPAAVERPVIGMDLGDKSSRYHALDPRKASIARGSVVTIKQAMEVFFQRLPPSVIVMEVGTHSPWVSRLAKKLGHEVLVANARRVKLITQSSKKNDRLDAEMLARLALADPQLLAPIEHRSEAAQTDLMAVRVRANLVALRTDAINAARGLVKSFGERLPKCDADSLNRRHAEHLTPAIRRYVEVMLEVVEELNAKIKQCDKEIERIAAERYRKETSQLRQVPGVGPVTALTFVLTLDNAARFRRSRDVGSFLGLRPKSRQSGDNDPELRISKEGDRYLRQLLVQCAQYILGRRGPDTDLKRWGQQIAQKGKKKAKRRAVVAVARKLAILLHRLWVSGERYEPRRRGVKLAAAA